MNFSLEGKTAIVTGASRGIGRATAIGLAEAGANVAVVSRSLPDLEKVVEEIRGKGRKAAAYSAHLGKQEEIAPVVAKILADFKRIDILINNAGTSPTMTPMIDVEGKLWDSIMNLNLKGTFFLSQAVARAMKDTGGGKIVNVSSINAFKPEPNQGIYCITKTALLMATKVLAVEWAPFNIKVNAIAPGNIHTRLRDSGFAYVEGLEQEMIKKTPLGHIGQPDELLGAMVFLASPASDYMTGQTIIVDGGYLLK